MTLFTSDLVGLSERASYALRYQHGENVALLQQIVKDVLALRCPYHPHSHQVVQCLDCRDNKPDEVTP